LGKLKPARMQEIERVTNTKVNRNSLLLLFQILWVIDCLIATVLSLKKFNLSLITPKWNIPYPYHYLTRIHGLFVIIGLSPSEYFPLFQCELMGPILLWKNFKNPDNKIIF